MLLNKDVDYEQMPPEYRGGVFVKREQYDLAAVDQKTGEIIIVQRTRMKNFTHQMKGYDTTFAELLGSKYYFTNHKSIIF